LLILSLPAFDVSVLAWFAMVPLFMAFAGKKTLFCFLLSYVCGIVFFLGIFNWILEIRSYTLLHHSILALYLGFYFAVFGLAFGWTASRLGLPAALMAAPFVWVSLEFARSNMSFLALPWGLLAHSQYPYPAVIQVCSLTGAYGLSFIIVAVNCALAALIYPYYLRIRGIDTGDDFSSRPWSRKAVVGAGAALLTFTLIFGYATISASPDGESIKVSVVQGNIDQAKKWDKKYAKFIMDTYTGLTLQAAEDAPDLIVWPETATPRSISRNPGLFRKIKGIVKKVRTYLLLGSSEPEKFQKIGTKDKKFHNSAFLVYSDGRKIRNQRYDKIRLFPFGEYLPKKDQIPWSRIGVPQVGEFMPGKKFTVFKLPEGRFGVTICWENMFPDLVRQFVKQGAQFIVNITNEAWFGKTTAPYQFLSMGVLRAAENQVPVIRCANTGISCFIDRHGRIIDRVQDNQNQDIFISGVLTRKIFLSETRTFYTQHGDIIVYVTFFITFLFLAFSVINDKKIEKDVPPSAAK
jgi:apolipoprotein N-acyltransferase